MQHARFISQSSPLDTPVITSRNTILLVAACVLATGCADKQAVPVTMPTAGSPEDLLIHNTPVIDVHTHTFNSRFLPVRGIVLGKRDMHPLFSLASDQLVIAIAELIVMLTEESPDPSDSVLMTRLAARVGDAMANTKGMEATPPPAPAELAAEPAVKGLVKLEREGASFEQLAPQEKARLKKFAHMFGGESHLLTVGPTASDSEYEHFFKCLIRREDKIVGSFRRDHGNQVDLMVSHMMDMAPTYAQEEDGKKLLRFESQQIPRVDQQQKNANGRMLYFAAYNPFRDQWGVGAGPDHSLKIVQDAYYKHGSFGVKVYPPSGYTVSKNVIPGCPFSLSIQPCLQWRARYKPGGVKLDPAELDRRLLKLLEWCAKEGVPVFTHCGEGEVEARKGYAKLAHPGHWKRLLEKNPQLHDLRLCFGHAGGGGFWFGSSDHSDWGKTVYELCCKYPNVCCEFGCFDAMANPDSRAAFSKQIGQLITDSLNDPYPGDFSTKIMYGSDWFMPMPQASDRVNYLNSFRVAILDAGAANTRTLYENFFFRNTIRFLNVEKRLEIGGLPPALRQRLEELRHR